MTLDVFESWMMSLTVHFKSLKRKVHLIMNNYVKHSLKHVGWGDSCGFSLLQFNDIIIAILPPNVTSLVHNS